MVKNTDRRAFLRETATLAASVLCSRSSFGWPLAVSTATGTRAWLTSPEQKFQDLPLGPWTAGAAQGATIHVDRSAQFQSILGFGGAFTDASCWLLSRMKPQARRRLMEEFFGAGGLRLSMGRTCVGSSDYSRFAYSFDDSATPDPLLAKFSIAHDREYILPTLREASQLNPEMFYFSTPWSPPGWMKAGGTLLGGSMRKEYFAAYAQYFVRFIKGYRAEGVNVSAVTTQNEVDTDQNGRMPAALWGQEYEAGFIREFLGPALREASPDTKIWILDHNYNLWGRAMDELGDPEVFRYVDGVAWHGYVGTPESMTRVHDAFPDKGAYWTEGGPDISDPDYATDWTKWAANYAQILKNWARCIVAWNLILDDKGAPNIGPFSCGGIVTLNSATQQLTRSGQYWAFAHYSKAVQRNARVIGSSGTVPDVEHVAFANPDGEIVVVLTNSGEQKEVSCQIEGRFVKLEMPRDSIVTLQFGRL